MIFRLPENGVALQVAKYCDMKTRHLIGVTLLVLLFVMISIPEVMAQCSICSKVAADQGEGAAKGFNAGILYLAAIPFSVIGFIGYRWYKLNMQNEDEAD